MQIKGKQCNSEARCTLPKACLIYHGFSGNTRDGDPPKGTVINGFRHACSSRNVSTPGLFQGYRTLRPDQGAEICMPKLPPSRNSTPFPIWNVWIPPFQRILGS